MFVPIAAFLLAQPVPNQPAPEAPLPGANSSIQAGAAQWSQVPAKGGGTLSFQLPKIGAADYPKAAMQKGAQGRTVIKLVVSPTGKLLTCETATTAGDAALDEAACNIYRARARFKFENVTTPQILMAPVQWVIE